MRRLVAIALTVAVIAGACGDDDTTSTTVSAANAALVAGLRQQIATQQSEDPDAFPMTDEEIGCFAVALVDTFGADRMGQALTGSFEVFMAAASAEERRSVVDAMFGCADLGPALARSLGGDGSLSAEASNCLADVMIGSQAFRDAVAEGFAGTGGSPFEDPELLQELLPLMLSCLSAEELAQLGS